MRMWVIPILLLCWVTTPLITVEASNSTTEPLVKPQTATIIKPKAIPNTLTMKPRTATVIKDEKRTALPTISVSNETPNEATAAHQPTIKPPTIIKNIDMPEIRNVTTVPVKYAKENTHRTDTDQIDEVPYVAAAVLKNCALMPDDEEITTHISDALNTGAKMIKFHLDIKRPERRFHGYNESRLYKPFFWVRSTGRHGTGLLLLRPEYDVLSLTTLELGVVTLHVNITESPSYCLSQLSYSDIELLVRELVMNDFQNTSSGQIVKLNPTDNVCNMHITNVSGVADFRYMCCQRSETLHIKCRLLHSDTWLNVLFVVITILKILVILFSPRLIPDSFYRVKHLVDPYIHRLQKPLTIKTVLTTNPDKFSNVKNRFKLKKFREMNKFKTTLLDMTHDVPYDLTVNQVHLRVNRDRLLPEDSAPVGLFRTMHETFFQCKIRERPSVKDCCYSNVFSFLRYFNKRVTWYTVLKRFMAAILLIFLATPWVIRIYVYFQYEHSEMHMRKEAASQKSLGFYFPGNVTLMLTPVHVLFIFIYLLLSLEACIFGVMGKKMKEQFKFVLRKCFRDMREMNQMDVIGWVIKLSVKPCTMFGGIGICIGLVTWVITLPFLLLILSFYLFPSVNVTLRLLAHFAVYMFPRNACSDMRVLSRVSRFLDNLESKLEMDTISSHEALEKKDNVLKSKWKRVQQLVVITLCLVSMYSLIFLLTEFVSFIVEIFVYTLMGLILNASMTLTYISLIFLLGVYGNDCFGHVGKKFLGFNKTMNEAIVKLGKEKVEDEIYKDEAKQDNFAFRIHVDTENAETPEHSVELVSNVDGYPRWQVSKLVLFLSKHDRPRIPKSFYFKTCKMPFYSVPGELLVNYLRAAAEFGMILLFLMFVLVVVLAFGDTYEISATNKMFATIAGGFLPFMLRNVVFKKHAVPGIDKDNIHFKVCLHNLLKNHFQTWPVYDIDVVKRTAPPIVTKPSSVIYEVNEDDNMDADESTEINPFINNGQHRNGKTNGQTIDLLIYVDEKIDSDDFPGLTLEKSEMKYNGSTSLLEELEPEEKEMTEFLKTV